MNSKDLNSNHDDNRRKGLLWLAGAAAAVVLALVALHPWSRPANPPVAASQTAAAPAGTRDELDAAQSTSTERPAAVVPRSAVPTRHLQPEATAGITNSPANAVASKEAQDAMGRLSQLDLSSSALTHEQATAVKQDLQRLVGQGAGAIPAIQQFLQQNRDISLDEIKGGTAVGYGSLRAAMFDTLRQIGGPEAQAALGNVLAGTADPAEIALLARELDEMAPGQYRDQAVSAARDTLTQIAENKTKVDVGPLFQTLQTYGDAKVVSELQNVLPQWQYYATMALAGLPEGQGLPALIQQAQQTGSDGSAKNTFAVQMLAQVAAQYPDASAALLEEAKSGQIPDRAWRRVAEALSGDQYHFVQDPGTDLSTLMRTPGVKTYHIGNTDENFYSVPISTVNPSQDDLAQRRALIDQLINATSNPAAADALQKAKLQLANAQP